MDVAVLMYIYCSCSNEDMLSMMVNVFAEVFVGRNLSVNTTKSKVIVSEKKVRRDEKILDIVSEFIHLSVMIDENGGCTNKGKNCVAQQKKVGVEMY